jgi:hypothetical protein
VSVRRAIVALACLSSAAMPAWLESRADARARAALSDCGPAAAEATCTAVDAVDVDVRGLWISKLGRRVGRRRIIAEDIRVEPGFDGIDVLVQRVRVETVAAPPPGPSAAASPAAPPAPSARPVPNTHGVPIRVAVAEPIELFDVAGRSASVAQLRAGLDGHGGLQLAATLRTTPAPSAGPITATARAVAEGDLEHWHVQGRLRVADDDDLGFDAHLAEAGSRGTLQTAAGGELRVRPSDNGAGVEAEFERFDLAPLADALAALPVPEAVDLRGATVDGTVETTRQFDRAHLEGLVLTGATLDHPKIARVPLSLDGVRVDGDLGRTADGGFAQLWLSRGDATAALAASVSPATWALDLELPTTECQTVIDALPHAMRDALDGLELRGQLDGHVRLFVDRAGLQRAREDYQGAPGEVAPRPGNLEIELPLQDSCAVVSDPVAIDLPGLLGPYRHHFVMADGTKVTRVMAPGAEGYVSLSRVELLGAAFRTLEDSRFLSHDGFDREQIGNAMWHNLIRGAVHRGASTISQQTARNLWLGVDRSAARKLQEALLTTRLEATVPKERILELYLNLIELGPRLYGVEAAAQYYFGRSADDLTVRQTVHIAALAPAPSRFAERFADGRVDDEWEAWIDRQIRRMYLGRHITRTQRDTALRQRTHLRRPSDAGE